MDFAVELLITDSGIIFTGLVGTGVTKTLLFSKNLKIFVPEYLFDELEEHLSRIKLLSSLSPSEVDSLISKLKGHINIVDDDTEYLALSLALNKCPIWSNDPHFKEQSVVQVYTTKELVELLKTKKLF